MYVLPTQETIEALPGKSAVRILRTYVRAKCEFARIHNLLTVKMHGLYSCGFNASMSVRNSQGVEPILYQKKCVPASMLTRNSH